MGTVNRLSISALVMSIDICLAGKPAGCFILLVLFAMSMNLEDLTILLQTVSFSASQLVSGESRED